MGEVPCAKAEVYKVIPVPARAFSPRQPAYGRAPAAYGRAPAAYGRAPSHSNPPLPAYRRAPAV